MEDPLAEVLAEVRPLAEIFSDAGFQLYLVGGIVRDLSLRTGLDDLDLDMTTNARPNEIRRLVEPLAEAVWAQGERFGTIGVRIADRPYEITTHRAEWYSSDSRKPEVVFGDDIEVDLSRRDFTVNAMALRLPDGELIDPFNGGEALTGKLLQTPIDPHVSFSDDPLRVLRAARFIARYDMAADGALRKAAAELANRLDIVSAERIRDELDKILAADKPGIGFEFLAEVDALEQALPLGYANGPLDVDQLSAMLDVSPPNRSVRRSLLFSALPQDVQVAQIRALKYSNDEIRELRAVLAGATSLEARVTWDAESVRRLVDAVGFDNMGTLFAHGDVRSLAGSANAHAMFEELRASEDLASFAPVLTGDQVMSEFGLQPGPEVGEVMQRLRDRRLRHGPASALEELAFLKTH